MAKISKSFSEYIKAKELTLTDEFYTLKGDYINTDYGFNFVAYNALQDVNDIKSNNYSNIILTKKQKRTDILEATKLKNDDTRDFVTTLSFIAKDNSNEMKKPLYLIIDNAYEDFDIDGSNTEIKLVDNIENITSNMIYRVQCEDETTCYISANIGNATFYLSYIGSFCYTTKKDKNSKFSYALKDNKLELYFVHDGVLKQVCLAENANRYVLALTADKGINKELTTIYVNSQLEDIDSFIDASWIRYNKQNAIDKVKNNRSRFDIEDQLLVHYEYNADDSHVNVIPLKNSLTYQGTVTDGQYTTLSNNGKFIDEPMVDFRNYTSLHTGINQELGADNITLSFTFTDQVIRINDGEDCIINIPAETENGLSPLFPYNYININNMAFVRNGAFASNVPYFADKVKKFQNESEHSQVNNYTYLCTWLYQSDENAVPVWMDRYYYPDLISRKKALTGQSKFDLSFENILDKHYFKDSFTESEVFEYGINPEVKDKITSMRNALIEESFIDKKSDLTFSPGTSYKYSRISKELVDEVFDSLAPNRAEIVKDQNSNDVKLDELISLNGENWRKLPAEFFANTQKMSFNTNIYLNPYKKMGIQLFGMDHNVGFNIQNRKDLCPFQYYTSEDSVYLLNNDFTICNQFNIFETYNEKITYFVLPAPFEDVYLLTTDSIYILDFNLRLKNRISFKDIVNLTDQNDITDKLSEIHIIQHNKNLYGIINNKGWNRIAKIVFNPERNNETPFTIRFLNDNEYFSNITVSRDNNLSNAEALFKSLYVGENGNLYAFNFDIIKVTHDNDTVYGIIKENKDKTNNTEDIWYYIFNQSLNRIQTSTTASRYAEFSSDISIDNIAFGPNGVFALVRGFGTDTASQTLEIYDKSKTKVYNYPLRDYSQILSLDYYRFVDKKHVEHDAFVALLESFKNIIAVVYYSEDERVETYYTSLPYSNKSSFKGLINSNKLLPRVNENKMYFNLNLNNNKSISYIWDLNEIEEGWYSINVDIDMDEAIYTIKINDITAASYNSSSVPYFTKHQYTNVSLLDGIYYIGTLPKQHGTTMNEILLGDSRYDPYSWKNSKIRNTTIYNKTLSLYEHQANSLHFDKINPLVLTIPCGIRNGIEEIVRYFKFNKPGSYTNKVKINIGGLSNDIKMQSQIDALKSEIITALTNNDCLIKIKEIEFI